MAEWHSRTYRLYQATKTKTLNITTALVLLSSSLSGAAPMLLSRSAAAAPGVVYANSGFGSLNLAPDRTTPSGGYTLSSDSLELRVDNTHANTSSTFYQTEGLQSTIPVSRSVKAELYVDSSWAGKPIRAGLWSIASSATATDLAYPIIEYTTVGDGGFTGWRVFDTINGGWTNLPAVNAATGQWYTLEITYNAATHSYDYYVNDVLVVSKTAADGANAYSKLQGIIFNSYNFATGDHAQDYSAQWRHFQTGQAPTVSTCSTINTVNTTTLSTWSLAETRSTGHNQLLANGLRIWTEGATSTDKAAGYYPVNFPLANLGDKTIAQSIDYTATTGITPGLQLAVDFDGNGTFDGYLVGESIYGNNWWLSNGAAQFVKDGAPNTGGGNGSNWFGTPNEWLSSFPNAQVKAIGYSLGSGVHGDGVIKRISLGCTDYTFSLAAPTLTAPSNGATVNGASVTNSWSTVDGAVKYEYQSFNDAAGHNLRFDGTYTATSKTATNVADGTVFYWHVRAIDSTGAAGPWSNSGSLWKVTIDSTKPSTPTPLTPGNNGYTTTNDFYFTWSDSSDNGSAVTYEFQSDGDGSFTSPWDSITNGNSEQNNLTTPKIHSTGAPDGTYYWRVRAIDAAGNKSGWSDIWKMTIDTHAPATPTLTFPADGVYRHTANTNHSDWSVVTDPHGPVTYYYESAYDQAFTNIAYGPHALSANTILNPGEPEVTYYWRVKACDSFNNCSAWSAPRTIHIDNTAPVAHVTAPSNGDVVHGTVTVSGTVTDVNPDHYYFVVKDAHGHVVADPGTVNQATVSSWDWDTTGVADGTYTVDLEARDKAGNKDAGSVSTVTVTVDNTAPEVTISGYGQTGNEIRPNVTATDPAPGTTLTYAWATTVSGSDVSISDPTVLEPVFTVHHDGTYSYTLTVTDEAGNATSKDFSFTYTTPVPPAAPTPQITTTATTPTTPTFTNVATGNTTLADNGTGILGSNTDSGDGKVKGDSTVNLKNTSNKNNGKFLFFGWWWLTILAVIFALLAFLFRRRNNED